MPVSVDKVAELVGGEDHFATFVHGAEEGQLYTFVEVVKLCGVGEAGLKRSMASHKDLSDWRLKVAKGYRYGTPKTIVKARKVLNA